MRRPGRSTSLRREPKSSGEKGKLRREESLRTRGRLKLRRGDSPSSSARGKKLPEGRELARLLRKGEEELLLPRELVLMLNVREGLLVPDPTLSSPVEVMAHTSTGALVKPSRSSTGPEEDTLPSS